MTPNPSGKRRKPRRPPNLGPAGASYWRWATASFDLEPPHVALVTQACRLIDRAEAIAATIDREGMVVAGSTGQPRPHPLIAQQGPIAAALVKVLDAVDVAVAAGDAEAERRPESRTSARARHAAEVRWRGPAESVGDLGERRLRRRSS